MRPYTLPFSSLGRHDVAEVGGKNSSLGEMISNLAQLGVSVPDGFATTVVENGLDAVELVLAGSCDLLVLDIGLPGIDGYEVMRRLRAAGASLRSARGSAPESSGS